MPDRPTHAATIRPAVVELPIWLASYAVHLGRAARRRAGQLADTYPDTATGQLHVAGVLAIAACLVDAVVIATGLFT